MKHPGQQNETIEDYFLDNCKLRSFNLSLIAPRPKHVMRETYHRTENPRDRFTSFTTNTLSIMVKLLRKYLNSAKRQGSKQRRIDSNMNRCEISYTRIAKVRKTDGLRRRSMAIMCSFFVHSHTFFAFFYIFFRDTSSAYLMFTLATHILVRCAQSLRAKSTLYVLSQAQISCDDSFEHFLERN